MASGLPFLYKSSGEHTGKGLVMLPGQFSGQVFIAGPDGKPIQNLTKDTTRHVPEPGDQAGEFGQKWLLPKFGGAYGNNFLIGIVEDGKTRYVKIDNGAGEFRGHIDEGEGTLDKPAEIAPYGPLGGGSSGVPGQFAPGQVGQFGATPAYVGGMFPSPVLAQYSPIQAAKYNFVDPFQFAEKYGNFARGEVSKNFNQAQDMALQSLDTELKGLNSFVPAASALKRQEISVDNQFNQQQRTQQVDQALPGVSGDLNAQADRARSFAAGKIPDAVANQGLEIGLRSQAADQSAAGGFGAQSSVARKASDLLSADQRIKLSQYGDQLLSGNINQKAGLYLAPTEYSNAGNQISVNPSVSTSQLASNFTGSLNQMAGLPTAQAFGSQVQQNQYQTGLQQQTNQFNAGNQLQLSEFNAGTQNQFGLAQFGYNAGYANSVAGAAQTNINTQFGLDQQNLANQIMQQYMQQSQQSGLINSLFSGGLGLLGAGGLGGLTNFGTGVKAGAGAGGNMGPVASGSAYGSQLKGAGLGSGIGSVVSGVGDALGGVGHALGIG